MDVKQLQVQRVLYQSALSHSLALACTVPGSDKLAIVNAFAAVPHPDLIGQIETSEQISEDRYRLILNESSLSVTVVHPGTKQLYLKYLESPVYYFEETAELYRDVTKPFIDALNSSAVQWVYNILDHVSEVEDIFTEDKDPIAGFTMTPDLKFKRFSAEAFYFSVIFRRRDLKSLRDLRGEHLQMLRKIQERIVFDISNRVCVEPRNIQIFFHYWPTFYHLHMHATNIHCGDDRPRAHPLSQVIRNLESDPNYYTKHPLTIPISSNHKLFPQFAQYYNQPIPTPQNLQSDLDLLT